jgi:hypothetical protein
MDDLTLLLIIPFWFEDQHKYMIFVTVRRETP